MANVFKVLCLAAVLAASVVDVMALDGAWRGKLQLGQMELPLVFNFKDGGDGKVDCTLDSPAQGAKGIPAEVTFCSADSVAVVCRMIGASYSGSVTADRITGNFSQRGMSLPLLLAPETPLSERRPQTQCMKPQKPSRSHPSKGSYIFPYKIPHYVPPQIVRKQYI